MDYTLIAYSGIFIDKNLEYDKIILSPKLLASMVNLENENEVYIFKLSSISGKYTHCTVLEFTSNDESIIYLPTHIMDYLEIQEGDQINLSLLLNKISKPQRVIFKPINSSFLQLNSYKEVLENSLRNYSLITKGDILSINTHYNIERLLVADIYPTSDFGCILNINIEVEFEDAIINNINDEIKNNLVFDGSNIEHKKEIVYCKPQIPDSIDNLIECKNCHSYIPNKSIQLHEVHCFRNYVYCSQCECKILKSDFNVHIHCKYCNIGIPKDEYEIHFNNKHKKIKCEYCIHESLPNEMDAHLANCEYLPTLCEWCNIKVPYNIIQDHEYICGSRTTECEICGDTIIVKKLFIHNAVKHNINPCKIKSFHSKDS